jgi:hypothetical protein
MNDKRGAPGQNDMDLRMTESPPPLDFRQRLAGAVYAALKAYAAALSAMTAAGMVLAAVSFAVLDGQSRWAAVLVAVFAVIQGIMAGAVLGARHASAAAATHALSELRLGSAAVRFVFERMLGIHDEMAPGGRGQRLVEAGKKMPLAQAERLVSQKMDDLGKSSPARGWLARKMRTRLLGAVEGITLNRFRETDARKDGIDLLRLKNELETTIDARLIERFRSGLTLWTILAVVGLPVAVALQTYVLLMWLRS